MTPTEEYTADAIEATVRHAWGPRRVRDARDGSGLRVDLTYDETDIALELTSLHDPASEAAAREVARAEKRLTDAARENGWGGWVVGVTLPARIRDVEAAVLELLAGGDEITPDEYGVHDLEYRSARDARAFVEHHRRLRNLGLSLVRRRSNADTVAMMLAGAGFQITGFGPLLLDAVERKQATLRETRPRKTHLGVLVVRWDVSDMIDETPPPALPEEIDVLWVVHPSRGSEVTRVWRVERGQPNWTVTDVSAL